MNMNLKILDLVGKRLAKGEKRYGKENITSDGRDLLKKLLKKHLIALYI